MRRKDEADDDDDDDMKDDREAGIEETEDVDREDDEGWSASEGDG